MTIITPMDTQYCIDRNYKVVSISEMQVLVKLLTKLYHLNLLRFGCHPRTDNTTDNLKIRCFVKRNLHKNVALHQFVYYLTHFSLMFHFYTTWKCSMLHFYTPSKRPKTKGFLDQCSNSIPPESVRKPNVFGYF